MTKNTKGAIAVITVLGIAFLTWRLMQKNKRAYANIISKNTGNKYLILLTFDEGYLKAWAKAITSKNQDFSYKEETYNVLTGKKIQK